MGQGFPIGGRAGNVYLRLEMQTNTRAPRRLCPRGVIRVGFAMCAICPAVQTQTSYFAVGQCAGAGAYCAQATLFGVFKGRSGSEKNASYPMHVWQKESNLEN